MIDMSPVSPHSYPSTLTQKLLQCGLRNGKFAVEYDHDLQGYEIIIAHEAGVTCEQFDCVREVAGTELVTFHDAKLQQAYDARVREIEMPGKLAAARAKLEKYGVLANFPERRNFISDELFAAALERQCGLEVGSVFLKTRSGLTFHPSVDVKEKEQCLDCVVDVIMYVAAKGEVFKCGFSG
ncbi:hypothetical protein [Sphingomonas faeni]|uniref:hypothetical protein n=1 Tax=Sphingomonas faeni TaxID=185950 RepID=UPI00278347B4|nr:hypothetical protein [Sphingomonas faeni]MDQ0839237.1 hypothetical protein [Sphingomonas faeni]